MVDRVRSARARSNSNRRVEITIIVVICGSGDVNKRKICILKQYVASVKRIVPKTFSIVSVDRSCIL